jgi:CRISPR/Cas system-associated exonuclease Cas4 (RecB family)
MTARKYKPAALQRLKDTFKDDGVVLPAMERHVMRKLGDPRPDDHSQNMMHPSDMCKPEWCGRHDYYRIVGTPVEKEDMANPSFRMGNVWTEGHKIHDKYQSWLWEMGVLYGTWECRECGHFYGALSPIECQFCKSPRLRYREVTLRRNQMMVEGHADAAIHDLDDWSGLVEIKSIGIQTLRFEAPRLYNRYSDDNETLESVWWKINRPFPSHVKQGQLYLWLAWPRYEQIVFIYECKWNQAVKEFVVSYNKDIIAPLLETAREVSLAVRLGKPPDRPLWAEAPDGKVCKSCEYRRTCWDMEPEHVDEEQVRVMVARTTTKKRKAALGATQ